MVGAALVEEADEFWPSPVGRYPLVTRDDFSEPLDSSFRDFHRALFLLTALRELLSDHHGQMPTTHGRFRL